MKESSIRQECLSLRKEADLWPRREEPAVRAELADRFLAYAKSIALRYRSQAESLDDLVQVASVGLMNAIERYDPARGLPFVAFASPTINGELKRHFRDRVSTMKVPRAVYERIGVMEKVVADLRSGLSHEPSNAEIAKAMGCSEGDLREAQEATQVRNPSGLSEGSDEQDRTTEERFGFEDEGFGKVEDRLVTGDALKRLSDRDRAIVTLRFRDELSQAQIAESLGCSQMQISRRLRSILDSLHQQVTGLPTG
jgi:RNA polymerase sigma-B factor